MTVAGFLGLGLGLLMVLGCGGVTEQRPNQVAGSATGGNSTGGNSHGGALAGQPTQQPSGGAPVQVPALACETPCLQKILTGAATSCKLCHTSRPAPEGLQSSMLDLESPNVTARLKDVPSKHTDIALGPPPACPVGDLLIDSAAPDQSWILKKIKGQQGTCGSAEPQLPVTLRADEMACFETYVYCAAAL